MVTLKIAETCWKCVSRFFTTGFSLFSMTAEQISVSISNVTSDSVVVTLSCGREETGTTEYSLEDERGVRMHAINLTCGEGSDLRGLEADTDYNLTKYYSNEIKCSIQNFKTDKNGEKILKTESPIRIDESTEKSALKPLYTL